MVKFKVLVNEGALRGCTVGKIYEGNLHYFRYFKFIDDVGGNVTVEIDERLEKVEENMNKEFTKDLLVAGEHVVELRNGTRMGLVELLGEIVGFNLQNQINNQGLHQNWYRNLSGDLTYPNDDYTVVKVYEATRVDIYYHCNDRNLELVWERKEKSQQEIEYEGLMQKISELQKQAEKLKP